jgi:hypothetical protein
VDLALEREDARGRAGTSSCRVSFDNASDAAFGSEPQYLVQSSLSPLAREEAGSDSPEHRQFLGEGRCDVAAIPRA